MNEAVSDRLDARRELDARLQHVQAKHKALLAALEPRVADAKKAMRTTSASVTGKLNRTIRGLVNTEAKAALRLERLRGAANRVIGLLSQIPAMSTSKRLDAHAKRLTAAGKRLGKLMDALAENETASKVRELAKPLHAAATGEQKVLQRQRAALGGDRDASATVSERLEKLRQAHETLVAELGKAAKAARAKLQQKGNKLALNNAKAISGLVNEEVELTRCRGRSVI